MKMICPYCEKEITLANAEVLKFCPGCGKPLATEPSSEQIIQERQCPVCCTSIEGNDDFIQCPDCGMYYHKECWIDNKGCATYGCKSSGCLNPPPERIDIPSDVPPETHSPHRIDEKIICPVCKVSLSRGETFCWSCGADLNEHTGIGTEYKFSGRYEPLTLTIGILLGVPVVLLLSLIYAYIVHFITIIYAAAAATYFFGIIIGWVSHFVLKFTKTRNAAWGIGISIILTFLALYFSWGFCIGIYFDQSSFDPFAICRGIGILLEKHSFNVNLWRSAGKSGIPISGVFLGILYLVEAGTISVMGILTAWGLNSSIGFCEKCKKWTKDVFKSPALSPISDITPIQNELNEGKIDAILALNRVGEHDLHTSLVIQACSCSDLNLLTINNVVVTEKDKKFEESETALLSQIIISPEAAKTIQSASWITLPPDDLNNSTIETQQ